MKLLYTLIVLLLSFSFSSQIREEIIQRYPTGEKKLLVKYEGEGTSEQIVEKIYYYFNGDTLIHEIPSKDYILINILDYPEDWNEIYNSLNSHSNFFDNYSGTLEARVIEDSLNLRIYLPLLEGNLHGKAMVILNDDTLLVREYSKGLIKGETTGDTLQSIDDFIEKLEGKVNKYDYSFFIELYNKLQFKKFTDNDKSVLLSGFYANPKGLKITKKIHGGLGVIDSSSTKLYKLIDENDEYYMFIGDGNECQIKKDFTRIDCKLNNISYEFNESVSTSKLKLWCTELEEQPKPKLFKKLKFYRPDWIANYKLSGLKMTAIYFINENGIVLIDENNLLITIYGSLLDDSEELVLKNQVIKELSKARFIPAKKMSQNTGCWELKTVKY